MKPHILPCLFGFNPHVKFKDGWFHHLSSDQVNQSELNSIQMPIRAKVRSILHDSDLIKGTELIEQIYFDWVRVSTLHGITPFFLGLGCFTLIIDCIRRLFLTRNLYFLTKKFFNTKSLKHDFLTRMFITKFLRHNFLKLNCLLKFWFFWR